MYDNLSGTIKSAEATEGGFDLVHGHHGYWNSPSSANPFSHLSELFPARREWLKTAEKARKQQLIMTLGQNYPDFQVLVSDFHAFTSLGNTETAQVRYFLEAIFVAMAEGHWKDNTKQVTKLAASLVLHVDDTLENLLLMCSSTDSPPLLNLLQATLNAFAGDFRCNKGHNPNSTNFSVLERSLLFGETPLILAIRNKYPSATLLLLQWGARTDARWLRFRSVFEVLLFSPHSVHASQLERRNIIMCMEYLCRTVTCIDIGKLRALQLDGYFPIVDDWETLVPDDRVTFKTHLCQKHTKGGHGEGISLSGVQMQNTNVLPPSNAISKRQKKGAAVIGERSSCPASLTHITRCSIRRLLWWKGFMPSDIYTLPLPRLLMRYIDLQID